MAESPSHKFGQIIGDLLEIAVEPFLRDFANNMTLNFVKYEVEIRYVGEDFIKATFQSKERIIEFLRTHIPTFAQL